MQSQKSCDMCPELCLEWGWDGVKCYGVFDQKNIKLCWACQRLYCWLSYLHRDERA